jgi:nitrate reductase alpha subunit
MTSTTLLSDVVFPAATWYEKHDLSAYPGLTPSSAASPDSD